MRFLSDRNIEMHRDFYNTLLNRYNIFRKSYPELTGRDIDGIYKTKIPWSEREAAAKVYSDVLAHKIYFSSFSEKNLHSDRIKREFGSVSEFLYLLCEESKRSEGGFLFVCDDGKRIFASATDDKVKILRTKNVLLTLDLCEHAYFYDYGFDREKYILNAVSHFDLSKI